MYTKELFHETVAILVKAYLNDTIEDGNYCACAVGNILAAKVGAKIVPDPKGLDIRRDNEFSRASTLKWEHPEFHGGEWYMHFERNQRKALLSNTEYSFNDIMRIEKKFEGAAKRYDNPEDRQFNGLMAVVDVLCEIHGMNEEENNSKCMTQRELWDIVIKNDGGRIQTPTEMKQKIEIDFGPNIGVFLIIALIVYACHN